MLRAVPGTDKTASSIDRMGSIDDEERRIAKRPTVDSGRDAEISFLVGRSTTTMAIMFSCVSIRMETGGSHLSQRMRAGKN